MIKRAARVVLLADSSKCGAMLSLNVAPMSDIDMLITDANLSEIYVEAFTQQGVEVFRV